MSAQVAHGERSRFSKLVTRAEHPDTLTSRSNLATVLSKLGRLEEAEDQ